MDTKTFRSTPQTLDQMAKMLRGHGVIVDPSQPSGEVTAAGWDVAWSTPQSDQIALTVKTHPFAQESFLWSKLAAILGPTVVS